MSGQMTGVLICFFIVMLLLRRPDNLEIFSLALEGLFHRSYDSFARWLCFLYGCLLFFKYWCSLLSILGKLVQLKIIVK